MRPPKPLTGRVPPEAVRRTCLPRLAAGILERYARIADLTGTVSDAMDDLGLTGAVPASVLAPSLPAARIVGQVVTVSNVERSDTPAAAAAVRSGRMASKMPKTRQNPATSWSSKA